MVYVVIILLLFFGILFTFFSDFVIKIRGGYEGKKGEFKVEERKQSIKIGGIIFIITAIIFIFKVL